MLRARRAGAAFTSVLMVGRQNLHLRDVEVEALSSEFGLDLAPEHVRPGVFADDFLAAALGAERITSIDASPHEGATVVHDMNRQLGAEHVQQYDAVIDGGSLEHIFDVPTALANVMRAARVGGRVYAVWPANNMCGHGFFQFSPEFAYRVFDRAHGFEAERVALVESRFLSAEVGRRRLVLDVVDPNALGKRVLRKSARSALLMVQARKVDHLDEPFAVPPQQSDYVAGAWSTGPAPDAATPSGAPRARALLSGLRELAAASRFNRAAYRRSS